MTNVLDTIAEAIADVIEPSPKEAPAEENASKPLPASTDPIDSREYNVSPDYPIQADSTTISGITGYVPKRLIDKAQPVIDLSRISGDFRFNSKIDNFILSAFFATNPTQTAVFQFQNLGNRLVVITSIQCSIGIGFNFGYNPKLVSAPQNKIWLDSRIQTVASAINIDNVNYDLRIGVTSTPTLSAGSDIMFPFSGAVVELGDTPIILKPATVNDYMLTMTGNIYPNINEMISIRGYIRNLLDKDLIQ